MIEGRRLEDAFISTNTKTYSSAVPSCASWSIASVGRAPIMGIVLVDDIEVVAIIDLVARNDAVLAAGAEEGDGNHQGPGEVEGVVLGEGKIVRDF